MISIFSTRQKSHATALTRAQMLLLNEILIKINKTLIYKSL